jgi:hypothetical protein
VRHSAVGSHSSARASHTVDAGQTVLADRRPGERARTLHASHHRHRPSCTHRHERQGAGLPSTRVGAFRPGASVHHPTPSARRNPKPSGFECRSRCVVSHACYGGTVEASQLCYHPAPRSECPHRVFFRPAPLTAHGWFVSTGGSISLLPGSGAFSGGERRVPSQRAPQLPPCTPQAALP